MEENEQQFSIEELATLVDLPVRTIRYYISEGLLPGPGARGKAAVYSGEHLLRLRLIRLLSQQHVPLQEIRDMLTRLSLKEIHSLLAEEAKHAAELEQVAGSPPQEEYVATLLKNAREARKIREQAPPFPPRIVPVPSPSPVPGLPPSAPVPSSPPIPVPGIPRESWRRLELAPGVELHVRSDAEVRHRSLLERILRAAGKLYPRYGQ